MVEAAALTAVEVEKMGVGVVVASKGFCGGR